MSKRLDQIEAKEWEDIISFLDTQANTTEEVSTIISAVEDKIKTKLEISKDIQSFETNFRNIIESVRYQIETAKSLGEDKDLFLNSAIDTLKTFMVTIFYPKLNEVA